MAPYSAEAKAALIKWLNTFPIDKVKNIHDLSDGATLAQVLEDIDSAYSRKNLVHRKNKLQSVIKGVRSFIVKKCVGVGSLVESPAFKTLAADKAVVDIFELVGFLLVAATSGPEREQYVETIMGLDEATATEIAKILQERMEEMEEYKAAGGDTGSYEPLPRTDNDVEFELENRYAAMLKRKRQFEDENARMRVQMADLTTRLEHLQENHDALLVSLEDAQDKINKPDADTEREIKRYEDQIRERDDLIESQEGALEANRQEQQKLRKELDSIRDAAARTIAAEDELKEVRLETLELTKKANTVDRFKQKLEAQKALETDLKNVEYENEELRSQLRDYNKMKQRLLQLEDTHKLFQNSIAKAEMEIFEIAGQKRAIDDERVQLQRELAAAEDKIAQAEQRVVDLEEERFLRSATGPGDSLADELQSEDAHRQNAHEVSRLRAEIALLKGNSFAAQESDRLRAQLEEAEAFRKVVEAKYRDVFEKEAISQQQLRLMMSSVEDNTKFVELAMSIGRLTSLTPEHYRHQAFIDLKLAHAQLTQDLAALQKGYEIIDADYQETRRSLLEAESDLNLIEKDDIDQLAEFKATQESLAESLKSELTALKKKKRALEIDYELQRTHLQESIIANAKLSGALEDSPSTKESADDQSQPPQSPATKEEIEALKERIRELEEEGSVDVEKVALQKENANLKREYNMMTMAWYDLSSRVQSNTVILQRRSETSKSWINKQRHAINPMGRR